MSQQLFLPKLSRRAFLKLGLGTCGVAAAAAATGASSAQVADYVSPPGWLKDAHAVIRQIQKPRIRGQEVRLAPESGDNRTRLQKAINDMSARGGGMVSLQPGRWWIEGPINLRSRVELRINEKAHLVFSGDREHYLPAVLTRWEGTDLYGYSPCIYAANETDVAITGSGILELARGGNIESWRFEQTEAQRVLRAMGGSGAPMSERYFTEGRFLRPSFMQFFRCERVLVEGISVRSVPFWGVHLLYTRHATVRSVVAMSDRVNNDGVDIDSSSLVLVEGCTFRTGDDCVAIKSGRDLDGRTVGIPSEKIVIRDCRMEYSKSAAVAIGSEMSGGVREVYLFRCQLGSVETAFNIKSNLDRGGFVEKVHVWNIDARECAKLIQVTTSYHGYLGGRFPPRFEDIELEDIRCEHTHEAVVIKGVPDSPVRRVSLRNIRVGSSDKPGFAKHAENLVVDAFEVGGKPVKLGQGEDSPASSGGFPRRDEDKWVLGLAG